MKPLLTLAATVSALALAGTATAEEPDPHTPNMLAMYCPGGGMGSAFYGLGYCDGVPYQDGSYWHIIQYGVPLMTHPNGLLAPPMQCVVNPDGAIMPEPAPPGGCGGAWQG